MRFPNRFLILIVLLSCAMSTYAQQQPVTEVYPLIISYRADRGSLERFYTVANSPERRERFKTFYKDYLIRLEQLPFETMSVSGRADYLLTKRDLENELFALSKEETEYDQIKKYTSFADPIYQLEQQRRRGKHLNSNEVAKQLNDIYKAVQLSSQKLKQEPNMTRELSARAEATVRGQQAAMKSVFEFYDGYDPDFSWWVTKPYQKLDSIMNKYAAALKNKVDPATLPKDDGSGII